MRGRISHTMQAERKTIAQKPAIPNCTHTVSYHGTRSKAPILDQIGLNAKVIMRCCCWGFENGNLAGTSRAKLGSPDSDKNRTNPVNPTSIRLMNGFLYLRVCCFFIAWRSTAFDQNFGQIYEKSSQLYQEFRLGKCIHIYLKVIREQICRLSSKRLDHPFEFSTHPGYYRG